MTSNGSHIASFNWGTLRADWDDPLIAEFENNLGRVNAVATRFPGFVWRLSDEKMEEAQTGANSPIDWANNDRVASTLAVWKDLGALRAFVYGPVHGSFVKRGAKWFETSEWPRMVLWTIPEGHRPTMEEAVQKLKHLHQNGPSAEAFVFTD